VNGSRWGRGGAWSGQRVRGCHGGGGGTSLLALAASAGRGAGWGEAALCAPGPPWTEGTRDGNQAEGKTRPKNELWWEGGEKQRHKSCLNLSPSEYFWGESRPRFGSALRSCQGCWLESKRTPETHKVCLERRHCFSLRRVLGLSTPLEFCTGHLYTEVTKPHLTNTVTLQAKYSSEMPTQAQVSGGRLEENAPAHFVLWLRIVSGHQSSWSSCKLLVSQSRSKSLVEQVCNHEVFLIWKAGCYSNTFS